jgi:hypothetical protein
MAEAVRRSSLLTLRRLMLMSLPEVRSRAAQQAGKWAERCWPPLQSPPRPRTRRAGLARGPFFPGAADRELSRFLGTSCPGHVGRLKADAEKLLAVGFDLLGYRGLRFGEPIDWHLDPVHRRRAPRIHWSRIDPLDARSVGDSKVIWELNRHQWLVTLAQAFRVTGDERYADACVRQLRHWWVCNPRGIGINWASSLEAALRLISWCWVLALLEGSTRLPVRFTDELLEGIAVHAGHVARYLSVYSSPNTHLTGEALGLFYAGSVLGDEPRARAWREQGAAILVGESQRQVFGDGVYFEQATCYQRYSVEILLHFLLLARAAGGAPPASVGDAAQRMLDFLLATRNPDGTMPNIGDADGGWLLPLAARDPDDLRGALGVAAVLFSRPDYAWAAGEAPPELVWLLGRDGLQRFAAQPPRRPAADPSRLFEAGGYAVMSNGWGEDAHRLIFDVGPLGCAVSSGHGHADMLSIQCSAFGQPYLVDPGTYTYAPEPEWRDHFRSARAHNTLTVDGREPARPTGPFAWASRPKARLRHWLSTPCFDYADADHDAFGTATGALRVRRRVLFVKPRCFIVVDDVYGDGEHTVELRFQLAALPLSEGPGTWLRVHGGAGRGLGLRFFGSAASALSIHEGESDPIRGWVSPAYGRRVPAPLLLLAARGPLPLRSISLLVPMRDVEAALPEVELVSRGERHAAGLRFSKSGEVLLFEEHEMAFECAESTESSR